MSIWKKAKDIGGVFLLSLVILVLSYLPFYGPVGFDFNTFFLYRDNYATPSGQVVIVKIDSESLDELQKTDFRVLALSKTVYAELIGKLQKLWARAIGFDVVFSSPASDEKVLADALGLHKNVVIGAWMQDARQKAIVPLNAYSWASWGAVNTKIEKNIVTKIRPEYSFSGRTVESLSVALYRAYIGDSSKGAYKSWMYAITPIRTIPLDAEKNALIKFFHAPETYPSYSLSDILNDRVPREKIAGKAILVGEYGTLVHDAYTSPVDPARQMPGVEFHANFLDSLIQGSSLRAQDISFFMGTLVVLIFGLSCIFYLLPTSISVGIFLVFEIGLLIFWRHLLNDSGILINLFAYALSGLAAFVSASLYRYLVTNRDRRYIEKAFSHYIAPDVVREIAKNPDSFRLGGEKREMTFFFSDIASFTTISEKLWTEKIFLLMEEYLSAMTDILISNKGTLDKYIGDAVMWFFNAPLLLERSEYFACKTALEQQAVLSVLNKKWSKEWIPEIIARIGINTWEAMVGNIGSKDRFNYTVIGDHVNLASRLEWVNKEYGTVICVGENTYKKTKTDFLFRELDTIRVKGKKEGVKIYELVGYNDDPLIDTKKYIRYEEALALYYVWKYTEAKTIFEQNTHDAASIIMAERCEDVIRWAIEVVDWIYEMKNK